MLEALAKEAPDLVEVHVQLATAYNRLERKDDAQRERAIVDRLNAEARRSRGAEDDAASVAARGAGSVAAAIVLAPRHVLPRQQPVARSRQPGSDRPRSAAPPAVARRRVRSAGRSRPPRRAGRAVGGGDRAVREGGQAEARLRRGLLVSGDRVLHARQVTECRDAFRKVVAARPEERRRRTRSSACASSA